MFGCNEEEMQEAEKLADLFDRMRKYVRENKICVVVRTAGVQPALDTTDLTVTWDSSQRPKVLDYINLVRTKERPTQASLKLAENAWDFTMPIGYSPLRDGVVQEMDGGLVDKISDHIKAAGDKYGIDSVTLQALVEHEAPPIHRSPVVVGDIHNMDVLRSYPPVAPYHDHMVAGVPVGQKVAVLGGRMQGRTALLLAALGAVAAQGMPMSLGGRDDDFGQDEAEQDSIVRYRSKSPGGHFGFGRQAADTSVSGAEKRRWSDKKPNGKPKKGWER